MTKGIRWWLWRGVALAAGTAAMTHAVGAQGPLTASDRAAIEQLSVMYAEALGFCRGTEYAALFAPDGYFASTFRGQVQGAEALVALVASERHCQQGTSRPAIPRPSLVVEPAAGGARSIGLLEGTLGAFEDVYVKTPAGWRFQSRTHLTANELAARQPAATPALTPLDYLEIRQLVARYAYAVDTGAEDGAAYAALFAADGAFVDTSGREIRGADALAALARRAARGPQSAFHFIVNHLIEPAPEGAVGTQFLLQLRIGDGDRPNGVFGGGRYDDVYVRTTEGWRFKRRQFTPSEGGPEPPSR